MERLRSSAEQFAALVEFMERYGDLAKPQHGLQGRVQAERLWDELTVVLNSVGGGVQRTSEKWKKVWADWKTKTKKKGLTIRQHVNRTGGGPSLKLALTPLEERVLAVIGISAVEGPTLVNEHGLESTLQTQADVGCQSNVISIEILQNEIPSPPPYTAELEATPLSPASELPMSPPAPTEPAAPPLPQQEHAPAAPIQPPGLQRRHVFRTPPPQQARRRRALTPFDRATTEYVLIEEHRLQLEETRLRDLHVRETERLRLQADSNNIHRELLSLLRRLTDIAQTWVESNCNS